MRIFINKAAIPCKQHCDIQDFNLINLLARKPTGNKIVKSVFHTTPLNCKKVKGVMISCYYTIEFIHENILSTSDSADAGVRVLLSISNWRWRLGRCSDFGFHRYILGTFGNALLTFIFFVLNHCR